MKLHPVLSAILTRASNNSYPEQREDNFRIALVIEGGAMRGVVSGGMVLALERMGLLKSFDTIYGSSAGAAAAVYFAAGQAGLGTSIYYEDINQKNFIDFRRLLTPRPVMSIDFLVDVVMRKIKPLDVKSLFESSILINILTTDIDNIRSTILQKFRGENDVFDALKATMKVPLLAGGPITIGGRRLMDGGILEQIPLEAALADKPSHILALLTRPFGQIPSGPSRTDRLVVKPLMDRFLAPGLGSAYLERPVKYANTIAKLEQLQRNRDGSPSVFCVRLPSSGISIARLETREQLLIQGAEEAILQVCRAFFPSGVPAHLDLTAHQSKP